MSVDDIKLSSVNWQHGMLLAPDHLLRQERYFDSALMWVLRYATHAYGLVGGGPRLLENERGTERHDPSVMVVQDDDALSVSVTRCRGLTPMGCIIDVDADHALHRRLPMSEMEGAVQPVVYVVYEPHLKKPTEGPADEFNPQMLTERSASYDLRLGITADKAPYSLAVARLRKKTQDSGFEKDPAFIPSCTSMVSYSPLTAVWQRLVNDASSLGKRYTDLYRAMQESLSVFKERGVEGERDAEMMSFVGRLVAALQDCTYEMLDPVQTPQRFFGTLQRFFHNAAVFLDISPAAHEYFSSLKASGETDFIPPLERQKAILRTARGWNVSEDLAVEARLATQSLDALTHLERTLEGKYIDFRFSPTLETMNFFYDRGGNKEFYKAAAKYALPKGTEDEWIFTFSQLHLEGRQNYRLVLLGQEGATLEKGEKIYVTIHLNVVAGYRRQPLELSCESRSPEQRNFEFDFPAPPEVPAISDAQAHVPARYAVRGAMLFVRQRFSGVLQPELRGVSLPGERSREDVSRRPAPSTTQRPPVSAQPRPAPPPSDKTTFARRPDRNRNPSPGPPRDRPSDTVPRSPWDTQKRPRETVEPQRRKRFDD